MSTTMTTTLTGSRFQTFDYSISYTVTCGRTNLHATIKIISQGKRTRSNMPLLILSQNQLRYTTA